MNPLDKLLAEMEETWCKEISLSKDVQRSMVTRAVTDYARAFDASRVSKLLRIVKELRETMKDISEHHEWDDFYQKEVLADEAIIAKEALSRCDEIAGEQ